MTEECALGAGVVHAKRVGNMLCVKRTDVAGFIGINGAFFRDDVKKNDYNVTSYEYQQLFEYWQANPSHAKVKDPPVQFDRNYIFYEEVNQNAPPKSKSKERRLPPATKTTTPTVKKTSDEIKRDGWDAFCYLAVRFFGFLITVYLWAYVCLFVVDYLVWYNSEYSRVLFDSLLHTWCAIRGNAYAMRWPQSKCNSLTK